jgi:hypothetical protein
VLILIAICFGFDYRFIQALPYLIWLIIINFDGQTLSILSETFLTLPSGFLSKLHLCFTNTDPGTFPVILILKFN